MADEPRRSGRATKGQHTKVFDDAEPSDPPRPKGKSKATKKAAKDAEQSAEEDDDENALIRCACDHQEDEGGRMMIQCDNCTAWQHNDCMGVTEVEDGIPDHYLCEQCSPDEHKLFHELLRSGLKPEQIAAQRHEEAIQARRQKKGKRGKSGRQSAASSKPEPSEQVTPAQPTPQPPESNKRKHSMEASVIESGEFHLSQPAKVRKSSSHATPSEVPLRGSSKPVKSVKDPASMAESVSQIQPESRRRAAESLKGQLVKSINEAANKRLFRIPDGETAASLGERYGIHIEHHTFLNHCGNPPDFSGPYKHQFTSVRFNVGKNMDLLLQLLNGIINPEALSRMTSAEMASEEQRRKDAILKEENEKQAMAIQDDQLRIRKTHKGEEFIESDQYANESAPASAAPLPNQALEQSSIGDTGYTAHQRSVSTPYSGQPQQSPIGSQPPSARSKSGFDLDRALRPDGYQSPPFSPYQSVQPDTVWRGKVEMPSGSSAPAFFIAAASHVAGALLGGEEAHSTVFPDSLMMDGRIQPSRADQYLTSLAASRSTDVAVYRLDPAGDSADGNDEFNRFYDYLKFRKDRYGVVGKTPHLQNHYVSDLYLIPLSGGKSEWPTFLQMLDYNVVERLPFERLLLAVVVLRYHTSSASTQGGAWPAGAPPSSAPPASATTPTNPYGHSGMAFQQSPSNPVTMQGPPPPTPNLSGSRSPDVPESLPHPQ